MAQRNEEEAGEETKERGDSGGHEEVMRRLHSNFIDVIVIVEMLHLVCLG